MERGRVVGVEGMGRRGIEDGAKYGGKWMDWLMLTGLIVN